MPPSAALSAKVSGEESPSSVFLTAEAREILGRVDRLWEPIRFFRQVAIDPNLILPVRGRLQGLTVTAADAFHWRNTPEPFYESWAHFRTAGAAVLEAGVPDHIEDAYLVGLSSADAFFEEMKTYLSSRKAHEPLIYKHLFELMGTALDLKDALHLSAISLKRLKGWMAREGFDELLAEELVEARDELLRNFAETELEVYLAACEKFMGQFSSRDYSAALELSDSLRVEVLWRTASTGD